MWVLFLKKERYKQIKNKIIAVDFDGTLCVNKYPEIGDPNEELIAYLKKRQANGEKLILWTNRVDDRLDKAVKWCAEHGLVFDAVNDNLPEIVESFGSNCRKIFANEYIDDRNRLLESCREKSGMELWAENEISLACKYEKPDRKDGEWDYGCACYESALKAFKCLCEDGHSGMSIGFTKAILNRLINNKPPRPIEDKADEWNEVSFNKKDGSKIYQCKRMSSLFKNVAADGTISYNDVSRYHGTYVNDPNVSYHSGLIDKVMDEKFPVVMPYIPNNKPFKVYTEDFLTDTKNGDFDTIGLLYTITPLGRRIELGRYFKEAEEGFDEIDKAEYDQRKEMAKKRQEDMKNGSK